LIADPAAILVVLAGLVWLALRLEKAHRLFRSLGAGLVAILLGMALSNSGILPGQSTTYQWLSSTGVSLAVALILTSVDVRSVMNAGPQMLIAFAIGAAATATGAITGALLWSGQVGPESWKLAGQFTGTYTGGGMNFAALGRALGTSNDMFTAAVAADVALTAIWMAICLTVPLLFAGRSAAPADSGTATEAGSAPGSAAVDAAVPPATAGEVTLASSLTSSVNPVPIVDLAALVVMASGALWAAGRLATVFPALPEVLWLTTIVLLLAQVPGVKALTGGAVLGNYLLLLFLAGNGAQSVIANIFRIGPAVFWFALTTVTIHGIGLFGIGRLLGIDAGTLAVASQANVGGPASAVALAGARGYADKVLPGVAVGLLGYAVGNYLGFTVATVMRGILGGTP
jgi:uncharacterized membrane protein